MDFIFLNSNLLHSTHLWLQAKYSLVLDAHGGVVQQVITEQQHHLHTTLKHVEKLHLLKISIPKSVPDVNWKWEYVVLICSS